MYRQLFMAYQNMLLSLWCNTYRTSLNKKSQSWLLS